MTGAAGTAFGDFHFFMAWPAEFRVKVVSGSFHIDYFHIQIATTLRVDMALGTFKL